MYIMSRNENFESMLKTGQISRTGYIQLKKRQKQIDSMVARSGRNYLEIRPVVNVTKKKKDRTKRIRRVIQTINPTDDGKMILQRRPKNVRH